MSDIDSLQIKINATATKANDALDNLVKKLDKLTTSLSSVDGSKLSGLASGVSQLGTAMQTMSNVKTTDFTRLAKNISNLNNLDASKLSGVSANISKIGASVSGLSGVSQGVSQITELANGIKQLGYKSADKAIDNIPKLATSMKQLMKELSTAPKVSQNLIDMTNALAKLARTGASSGKAAQSLSNSFTGIYKSSGFAVSGIKKVNARLVSLIRSIAPVVGLVKLIDFGKQAMEISSDLTEVQNVVDVTFGDYKQKIEDLASVSIPELGMSELSVKEIGSRFQAMGTAMGFSTEKMADMSVELTRLTGDMASFYNVEQETMGKALQSIFTGETEPMRKYGIDLTNATIQQYALSQGITTSINKMTQLEKAQLRYNYVVAQTTAAQGDFIRTQDTWANQIRILKENLKQLASIIGGSLINAFKPLIQALNSAMSYIIAFAQTVSNALGKIFGWKYESGSSGITTDFDDAADSANDIADSTDQAAKNVEKIQKGLRGFDELKLITTPEDTSGTSGNAGSSSASTGEASGGKWVEQDSIFKAFESEIDTLYKLGEYIGEALTKAMNSIDWNSVYEKARNFGAGLAQFLNGLISPELFGAVGKTIAGSLNTALWFLNSFGDTFDWTDFGVSIATGINEFFTTFDFALLANTIDTWVQGIWTTIKTTIENIKWEDVWNGAKEFLENIDLKTIEIVLGVIAIKKILGLKLASTALSIIGTSLSRSIAQAIASKLGIEVAANAGIKTALTTGLTTAFKNIGATFIAGLKGLFGSEAAMSALTFINPVIKAITGIGSIIGGVVLAVSNFFSMWKNGFSWLKEALMVIGTILAAVGAVILGAPALVAGVVAGIVAAVSTIAVVVHDNWDKIANTFKELKEKAIDVFNDVVSKAKEFVKTIKEKIENIRKNITENFEKIKEKVRTSLEDMKNNVSEKFSEIKNNISEKVEAIKESATEKFETLKSKVTSTIEALKNSVSSKFETLKSKVTNTIENLKNKVSSVFEAIKSKITSVVDGIKETMEGFKSAIQGVIDKLENLFSFNGKSVNVTSNVNSSSSSGSTGSSAQSVSVGGYATGGFPKQYSMFMAGENGTAELLGTVGGKTAVAGGAEITGISDTIRATSSEEVALLKQQNVLLQAILEKEYGISKDDIGKAAQSWARDYSRRTGREAYSF